MRRVGFKPWLGVIGAVSAALGCAGGPETPPMTVSPRPLESVATFDRQVTGVTVAPGGGADGSSRGDRLFVCFPYWSPDHGLSVAEVLDDGSLRAYPDERWNSFRLAEDGKPPANDVSGRFVCVQSVVADGKGSLWVLDPAAPMFQGPIAGGAKLVRIDLATGQVRRIIPFDDAAAPQGSYLNDVRIDHDRDVAYLTDSGLGAIVVVDLDTGAARRVLADHPSTRAEDIDIAIGGEPLTVGNGQTPMIHADGIALSPDDQWLYYKALTGRTLYRVPTAALRDRGLSAETLAEAVEDLGPTAVCDGMIMDGQGRLYLTALEDNAILRRDPSGAMAIVARGPELAWPDTLSIGADGRVYISVSQIHLKPRFNDGQDRTTEPWSIQRFEP